MRKSIRYDGIFECGNIIMVQAPNRFGGYDMPRKRKVKSDTDGELYIVVNDMIYYEEELEHTDF